MTLALALFVAVAVGLFVFIIGWVVGFDSGRRFGRSEPR